MRWDEAGRGWYPRGGSDWNMHDGVGWGGTLLMSLLTVLLLGLAVAVVALAVRSGHAGSSGPPVPGSPRAARSALDVLDERYARGELDDEEYLRRRDLLRAGRA